MMQAAIRLKKKKRMNTFVWSLCPPRHDDGRSRHYNIISKASCKFDCDLPLSGSSPSFSIPTEEEKSSINF